jgi:hypothetical protein
VDRMGRAGLRRGLEVPGRKCRQGGTADCGPALLGSGDWLWPTEHSRVLDGDFAKRLQLPQCLDKAFSGLGGMAYRILPCDS